MKLCWLALLSAFVMRSASLQGSLHDQHGKPVASASIEIRIGPTNIVQTVKTDEKGRFLASHLSAGTYNICVANGSSTETVHVGPHETKKIDLVLKPAAGSIQFSDEPNFVVAGVTDNTYMGGHGSDVRQRSLENLFKATDSLKQPAATQSENNLRAALQRDPANASLHHALADAEEQAGKPLEAAQEYQRAAELDPAESNLFDWATELLIHGVAQPANEVFGKGIRLYPQSSRMLIGAAVALYSQGEYGKAGEYFFRATDLHPTDPTPYLILAQTQSPDIVQTETFSDRMARFAELQPDNALANYYYGLVLFNQKKPAAEARLKRAVILDPTLGEAYLHLGVLYAQRNDVPAATGAYQKAIAAEPNLAEAHYRLAAAYRQTGDIQAAERETQLFQELATSEAEKRAFERSHLQRFVVTLKAATPNH